MAVSGRKVTDFSGSVYKGSAEDFDHSCEPCLAIGQHIESHGFCVECQEYLCKNCFAYHQRIKATRSHQLLDKDNMSKQITQKKNTTVCTEKCTIHRNELIKFFCTNHEFLGCNDCITLDHRTCKIDYIPDSCADIGDSDEYRATLEEIDQKMKDIKAIVDKANQQDDEVDSSHGRLTEEICEFRKEIDDHFDLLQRKLETKAEEQKYKNKEIIKKVLETCTSSSSGINEFKTSLQDSKTSQNNGKTYILIKQAKTKLNTDNVITGEESLEQAQSQYIFERNTDVANFLFTQDEIGTLYLSSTTPTSRKQKSLNELTHKGNIALRTKSDETVCSKTGCALLPSKKLVIADNNNSKLKVVDIERQIVKEEKQLELEPWDIAVLPNDQIAVTIPENREILIFTTADQLSIIRKIPVSKGECRGITYHQDHLYVVCLNPHSVLIVDMLGNTRNSIHLQNAIFNSPNYILLSEDSEHIYLSNYGSNSVVSVTLQGDISAVYKHKDIHGPSGMVMLDDGSLLVCCRWKGSLHRISGDLKQGQIIRHGLEYPQSICYHQHEQEFYIGGQCDQLMMMKPQESYK